jgi:cell division protein FtsI/penicillin-binding protein 2
MEEFNWIGRKLSEDKASRLTSRDIPGLFCQTEMKRIYSTNGLGLDLIGTVDIDNQGISGLEYVLNGRLAGSNGRALIERDAIGKVYRVSSREIVEPKNGCDVVLTIDLDWQAVVEAELDAGVEKFNAQSGTAVFLRPNDGAILAMASCYPDEKQGRSMKNEAISDLLEPGSCFKLVTAAAVLEEGVVGPDDIFDCDSGKATFSGRTIRDDKQWGKLKFRDIFRVSSNIGVGKAALRLGGRKLNKYVRNFGFGTRTGIDLPGESAGLVREPEVWSDHYTASLAMGHGLSVNALQLATAFNVVPSQGRLMRPYIIRRIVSPSGEVIETGKPHELRKVISERTCKLLMEFMASVVDSGTAKHSKSKLVSFSGKTGTAQKPNLKTGGYYQNRFMSSFAGYFPNEDPVAVGVVILDDAQPIHYAGWTAAKVFAKIAERIASLEHLPAPRKVYAENDPDPTELIRVPDFVGSNYELIRKLAADSKLDIRMVSEGSTVIRQYPDPGSELVAGERVILYFADDSPDRHPELADMVGLSVRQAVIELTKLGYEIDLQGSGLVKSVKECGASTDGVRKRCRIICSID